MSSESIVKIVAAVTTVIIAIVEATAEWLSKVCVKKQWNTSGWVIIIKKSTRAEFFGLYRILKFEDH